MSLLGNANDKENRRRRVKAAAECAERILHYRPLAQVSELGKNDPGRKERERLPFKKGKKLYDISHTSIETGFRFEES